MPINENAVIGEGVRIFHATLVNPYGCVVGDETRISPFVEVQSGVIIGKRCKIQSHSFICEGVILADRVFLGHGVMFTNDLYPRATTESGELKGPEDWSTVPTYVDEGAGIGSNAT